MSLATLRAQIEQAAPKLFAEIVHPRARAYLAGYALTGKWTAAADLAGISVSLGQLWRRDKSDEIFQAALVKAQLLAADLIESELMRRAVEGVDEPVFQQGRCVGYIRKYSDRLMEIVAKGALPDKYRERHEITGADGAPLFALAAGIQVNFGSVPKAQDQIAGLSESSDG